MPHVVIDGRNFFARPSVSIAAANSAANTAVSHPLAIVDVESQTAHRCRRCRRALARV